MYPVLKRLFDLVVSATVLVLVFPILTAISIWIKLESAGPILYRGVRVGQDGVTFKMCKFRTMLVNAEQMGGSSTADDDPRITRVGKWIRRYKLDELPQFFNVIKGEMSLVGPRPEVKHYVEMFTEKEKAILSVKPGITDWASLWNRDEGAVLAGSPDPEKNYMEEIRPEKIRLQLEYVAKRSFSTDLIIVGRTLMAVLFKGKEPLPAKSNIGNHQQVNN
jgi:lipopolysaccharide/colanic/teichoic acid biosynthesis glycosyltransferase